MRTHFQKLFLAMLALAICTGTLQATISINPAIPGNAITLTCDAITGTAPLVNVGITSTVAATSVSVSIAAAAGSVGTQGIMPVQADGKSALVGNAQSVGAASVNFGFHLSPGCKNAVHGSAAIITFSAPGVTSVAVTANIVLTNTASTSLVASPAAVTLTCTKGGSPGPAQTINITSMANAGTGFYVDTGVAVPGWMSVAPTTSSSNWATVNPGPTVVTLTPQAACTSLALGQTPAYNLTLANPPAKALVIPVYMQVGNNSPLIPSASTISLTYTKGTLESGSNTANTFNLTTNSVTSVMFNVNASALPQWLRMSATSGSVITGVPAALEFFASDGAVTLPVGNYSYVVHFIVANSLDATVTVNLTVQASSSTLSLVENASQQTKNWTIGDAYPTYTVTAISTDAPIAYSNATVTCYTTNNNDCSGITPSINPKQAVAYSFGTPITVTFGAGSLNSLLPGKMPQWQVSITNPVTSGSVTVILTLNILSPGARITAISPASLPLNPAPTTQFTVTLSGSGFVAGGMGSATQTVVGVLSGGFIWPASSITSVTWINTATMNVTLTVPSSPDQYFPWATGPSVVIAACNPNGSTCNTAIAGAQVTLYIGGGPIIQSVTSASTFAQPAAGAFPVIAPYDIVSVFGSSFCNACGVINGQLSTGTMQYTSTLSPDNGAHTLSVQFWSHSASPTLIATAPLLFASSSQINLLVPDAVWAAAYRNQLVDMVVNYGPANAMVAGNKYPVLVNATDTGIFTVGGDGQGGAAALDFTANNAAPPLVTATTPAVVNVGSSDTIELFVTGLGEPDATETLPSWAGATCMAPSDYVAALGSAFPNGGVTSADGLVLQSGITNSTGYITPCFKSGDNPNTSNLPTVTIGGVAATVIYAGWVPDSVAGLYQLNVTLPTGHASGSTAFSVGYASNFKDATGAGVSAVALQSGAALPVKVTSNGVVSQSGVTLDVVYSLTVTANHTALTGTAASYTVGPTVLAQIQATNGSGTYTFVDGSSALPAGFAINANTGAITCTSAPSATSGDVPVTITVTDTNTNLSNTIVIHFNLT